MGLEIKIPLAAIVKIKHNKFTNQNLKLKFCNDVVISLLMIRQVKPVMQMKIFQNLNLKKIKDLRLIFIESY